MTCTIHRSQFWNEQLAVCWKCYEIAMANPVVGCKKHDPSNWVESYPSGIGYCRACTQEQYDAALPCPHCGIKKGFAPGTGDCGCNPDPQ